MNVTATDSGLRISFLVKSTPQLDLHLLLRHTQLLSFLRILTHSLSLMKFVVAVVVVVEAKDVEEEALFSVKSV